MPTLQKRVRVSNRTPKIKKPCVAECLHACMARERHATKKPGESVTPGRALIPLAVAAKTLGFSVWTLRSWIRQKQISYHRVGAAGRVMIDDAEIARVIASTEVSAVNAA
jgi:predicted ABC-type ATPase